MNQTTNRKFAGLMTRRERWGLSARGWITLILTIAVLTYGLARTVQPFLAVTHRTDARVLVVEGWIREFAVHAAVEEFRNGHYDKIYTTGGPIIGTDGATNNFNTAAYVGADLLIKAGLPAEFIQRVPSHVSGRDRTYSSALALQAWFLDNHLPIPALNILTEDVHARRTRLLFTKVFVGPAQIGIISIPNPDYEARHWWHYSEGVRDVLGESIAYLYARFLFHPAK